MADGFRTKEGAVWGNSVIHDSKEIQSLLDAGFPLKKATVTQQADGSWKADDVQAEGSWDTELPSVASLPGPEVASGNPPVDASQSGTGAAGSSEPSTDADSTSGASTGRSRKS